VRSSILAYLAFHVRRIDICKSFLNIWLAPSKDWQSDACGVYHLATGPRSMQLQPAKFRTKRARLKRKALLCCDMIFQHFPNFSLDPRRKSLRGAWVLIATFKYWVSNSGNFEALHDGKTRLQSFLPKWKKHKLIPNNTEAAFQSCLTLVTWFAYTHAPPTKKTFYLSLNVKPTHELQTPGNIFAAGPGGKMGPCRRQIVKLEASTHLSLAWFTKRVSNIKRTVCQGCQSERHIHCKRLLLYY